MPRLHFQHLQATYLWANADGTNERQYGQPGYEVRQVQGTWRACGPEVDVGGMLILADGLPNREEAMALCEKDVLMYERACAQGGIT